MGHGTTCTHLVVGPSLVAQSPGDPPSVTGSQVRFGGSVAALGSCVARIGDAVTVGKLDPVDPPAHAVSVRPREIARTNRPVAHGHEQDEGPTPDLRPIARGCRPNHARAIVRRNAG